MSKACAELRSNYRLISYVIHLLVIVPSSYLVYFFFFRTWSARSSQHHFSEGTLFSFGSFFVTNLIWSQRSEKRRKGIAKHPEVVLCPHWQSKSSLAKPELAWQKVTGLHWADELLLAFPHYISIGRNFHLFSFPLENKTKDHRHFLMDFSLQLLSVFCCSLDEPSPSS